MATGDETKVDTKLFVETADTITAVAKDLEGCFTDWAKIMQTLRGAWQGDTSDNFKNTAEAVQKSASDMLRKLAGYKAALYEIAGIYVSAEKDVQETGKSLKFDKAFR